MLPTPKPNDDKRIVLSVHRIDAVIRSSSDNNSAKARERDKQGTDNKRSKN